MIRFVCQQCRQAVRVPDAFGGRKGRCPACKAVVSIPTASEPEGDFGQPSRAAGDLDSLAAAVGAPSATDAPPSPPPPPHQLEQDSEPELRSASDPSNKTDRMEAIQEAPADEEPAAAGSELVGTTAVPVAAHKGLRDLLVIGAGVVVALAVAVGIVWYQRTKWQPPMAPTVPPLGTAPAATKPAVQSAQPGEPPKPPPLPAAKEFELDDTILSATAFAPAGTFCMLHVEFGSAGRGAVELRGHADESAAAFAASAVWTDAANKVRQGTLPRHATLFLTSKSAPLGKLFGKWVGELPGPSNDPAGGMWALAHQQAEAPHFLLRLTGKAAQQFSAALLERAAALKLGQFDPGKPAAYELFRLAPPAPGGADQTAVMLLGTVETLDETGKCRGDAALQQRLRQLLKKAPTDRPLVGCVFLERARTVVNAAAGLKEPSPAWSNENTILIFSLDPGPAGKATLLLARAPAGALKAVEPAVAPMMPAAEGEDVRIEGLTGEGLGALARLMPGFRPVLLKALALAEAAPPPAAAAPATPTPAPLPPTATKPAGPVAQLDALCTNPQCPSRGQVYKVGSDKVPPAVVAGTEPLVCPHCGKPSAVLAVKCGNPKCAKPYAQTLDACPHCGTKKGQSQP